MVQETIDEDAISLALSDMNPWWETGTVEQRQPGSKRHACAELETWLTDPPFHKAINITGPRYVGKTTLLRQMVERMLDNGVAASRILFAAFDDYRLSGARLDQVVRHWHGRYGDQPGMKYLFLDELQRAGHWDTMTKKMVDEKKDRRIFFTGSAISIGNRQRESGAGRWFDVNVGTLSFGEYLAFSNSAQRDLSGYEFGTGLDGRTAARFSTIATGLEEPFNRYLLQGGFPETALEDDFPRNRRLVIDQLNKVLSRGLEEHVDGSSTLEFAAMHRYFTQRDGGILNVRAMASNMRIPVRKASQMVEVLMEANLVRALQGHEPGQRGAEGKEKNLRHGQHRRGHVQELGPRQRRIGGRRRAGGVRRVPPPVEQRAGDARLAGVLAGQAWQRGGLRGDASRVRVRAGRGQVPETDPGEAGAEGAGTDALGQEVRQGVPGDEGAIRHRRGRAVPWREGRPQGAETSRADILSAAKRACRRKGGRAVDMTFLSIGGLAAGGGEDGPGTRNNEIAPRLHPSFLAPAASRNKEPWCPSAFRSQAPGRTGSRPRHSAPWRQPGRLPAPVPTPDHQ